MRAYVCPNCGTTLEDFRKTGLLGCADCYLIFREEILSAVKKVQGRTRYVGRKPNLEAENKYAFVIEQDRLNESREKALREGRYSDADDMRRCLEEIARIIHPQEDHS